jgi:hypothetical protein
MAAESCHWKSLGSVGNNPELCALEGSVISPGVKLSKCRQMIAEADRLCLSLGQDDKEVQNIVMIWEIDFLDRNISFSYRIYSHSLIGLGENPRKCTRSLTVGTIFIGSCCCRLVGTDKFFFRFAQRYSSLARFAKIFATEWKKLSQTEISLRKRNSIPFELCRSFMGTRSHLPMPSHFFQYF